MEVVPQLLVLVKKFNELERVFNIEDDAVLLSLDLGLSADIQISSE